MTGPYSILHHKDIKTIDKADRRLIDLVFHGLEEGIKVKKTGKGLLVPFVITEKHGERNRKQFDGVRTDIGVEKGMDYLSKSDINFGVIVFDGYLTIGGKRDEAVIVRGYDSAERIGYSIGQRYSPQKLFGPFRLIGNPAFLCNEEQILRS
jgi:hypothetical protein